MPLCRLDYIHMYVFYYAKAVSQHTSRTKKKTLSETQCVNIRHMEEKSVVL